MGCTFVCVCPTNFKDLNELWFCIFSLTHLSMIAYLLFQLDRRVENRPPAACVRPATHHLLLKRHGIIKRHIPERGHVVHVRS
jgi:hypothetical protein